MLVPRVKMLTIKKVPLPPADYTIKIALPMLVTCVLCTSGPGAAYQKPLIGPRDKGTLP